jgi:hypothetical protein
MKKKNQDERARAAKSIRMLTKDGTMQEHNNFSPTAS